MKKHRINNTVVNMLPRPKSAVWERLVVENNNNNKKYI